MRIWRAATGLECCSRCCEGLARIAKGRPVLVLDYGGRRRLIYCGRCAERIGYAAPPVPTAPRETLRPAAPELPDARGALAVAGQPTVTSGHLAARRARRQQAIARADFRQAVRGFVTALRPGREPGEEG